MEGGAMFGRIKNRWKEARADGVRSDVYEIFSIYEGYGSPECCEFLRVFDDMKNLLEMEYGAIAKWPQKAQKNVVKQLFSGAKRAHEADPYGASGMALLSMYIDIHTIPGENAVRLKNEIDNWHHTVAQQK